MHQVPAPRPPLSRAGPMFFVQAKMAANLPSCSKDAMQIYFHTADQMARDLWVMKQHHGKKGAQETPLIDRVMVARDSMVDMAKTWAYVHETELVTQRAEEKTFLAQLNSMKATHKKPAMSTKVMKAPAMSTKVMKSTKTPAMSTKVMKAMKKA